MDNRVIPMFVSGNKYLPRGKGKRFTVTTDLVTGAMNGFRNTQVDNFNLGNAVKNLGKLAGATGIPIISQVGNGLSNVIENKQASKQGAVLGGTLADYEGQLLRDKSDKAGPVYLIQNGKPIHQTSLTDAQWKQVTDVARLPPSPFVLQGGLQGTGITKSMTPILSPIAPSYPVAPGDANIAAAANSTGQSMADKLVQYVESLPSSQKQTMLSKAQGIFDSGSNGLLTKAQKALQNASMGILPKTKAVKDAEALLTAPQYGGNQETESKLSFSSPWVIGGLIAVVIGIVIIVALKR